MRSPGPWALLEARRILTELKGGACPPLGCPTLARVVEAFDSAKATRPGVKMARKAKGEKKAAKRDETADLRQKAWDRSRGVCECGCGLLLVGGAELDHVRGRGRAKQTLANVWLLAPHCHRLKHRKPLAVLPQFVQHAKKHGYIAEENWAVGEIAYLKSKALARASLDAGRAAR